MPDVLGLSAFGLGDTCAGTISLSINAFHPSAVIFPRTWRGAFQTGREASESRIETGMNWPLEARVTKKTILRRVPVALLWSKLVRDGDRLSYWAPGQGSTRFSTAAAIEAHLAELLKRAEWKDQSVVVAIPDTLDEMGQEEILRAFGERRGDVQLLWRPVAAAMEWLHGLGTDFRIHPGDWMLVIYLGPDFFEFTPFGLQADGETGYPLPVRSRGIKNTLSPEWTGPGAAAPEIHQEKSGSRFCVFPKCGKPSSGPSHPNADISGAAGTDPGKYGTRSRIFFRNGWPRLSRHPGFPHRLEGKIPAPVQYGTIYSPHS